MGMTGMGTGEDMTMADDRIDGIRIGIIIIAKDKMIGVVEEENGIESIIMIRTGKIREDTGKSRLHMTEEMKGGDPITNPKPKKQLKQPEMIALVNRETS